MLSQPFGDVMIAAGTNSAPPTASVSAASGRITIRSTPTFALRTSGSYQFVGTGAGAGAGGSAAASSFAAGAAAPSSAASPGAGATTATSHAISDTAAAARATGDGRRMRGQLTRKPTASSGENRGDMLAFRAGSRRRRSPRAARGS